MPSAPARQRRRHSRRLRSMLACRVMRHAVGRRRAGPASRAQRAAALLRAGAARASRRRAASVGAGRSTTSPVSPSMITEAPGGIRAADVVQADDRRHAERAAPGSPCDTCGSRRRWQTPGCASNRAAPTTDGVSSSAIEHARRVEILQQIAGAALSPAQVHAQAAGRRRAGRPSARADTDPRRRRTRRRSSSQAPAGPPTRRSRARRKSDRAGAADEDRIVEHQELGVED